MRPSLEANLAEYVTDVEAGRSITPDQARSILALTFDPDDDERVEYLFEQCNEGLLTGEERSEYERYSRVALMMMRMKAVARMALKSDQLAPVGPRA